METSRRLAQNRKILNMSNLIITQLGGPTAVINASVAGIISQAQKSKKVKKIFGARYGVLGVLEGEFFDLTKMSKRALKDLKFTPSSALGTCRYKVKDEDLARILKAIKTHNIGYFFVIGGNDSMDTATRISNLAKKKKYPLQVVGVPKTIDNDLLYTDHCPGYGSVIRWLAVAVKEAGLDTKSLAPNEPVKIIETMGRDSGWVTAGTALAKDLPEDAPHLIYLPEIPFDKNRFLKDVRNVYKKYGRCVITVCEGLKDKRGRTLVESKTGVAKDAFSHAQRGGVSKFLCDLVMQNLKIKARWDKPGTIQRVSKLYTSPLDLKEAEEVGKRAVKMTLKGISDIMVTIERKKSLPYRASFGTVSLKKVAGEKKIMPRSFINKQGNFVTKKFINWARPLIGGPLPSYFKFYD